MGKVAQSYQLEGGVRAPDLQPRTLLSKSCLTHQLWPFSTFSLTETNIGHEIKNSFSLQGCQAGIGETLQVQTVHSALALHLAVIFE